MNLEEASKHPDRVAAEAKRNAYEAIWQAARTLIDSEGLDGRAKFHLIGAIEAACVAYRNCEAVESVIVSSGFFPEEVAVTPETAEPKPDKQDEPDEQEVLVHSYMRTHGDVYKMNSLDRIGIKFVVPVDLPVYAKGVVRARSVFGLETSNDDNECDYRVYALVLYEDAPVLSYFHEPFAEFSVHEKEQLIDMMKQGNAGFFGDEKLGADKEDNNQ